jgi:hypothetical protein
MPELSPECIDRLRELEARIGMLAMRIDDHAAPGGSHRLQITTAAARVLTQPVKEAHSDLEEECREVFRTLEPLIGMLVTSLHRDEPVDLIRRHLDAALTSARALLR